MAIGGSPPNAPRDKDGTKGTAGRYAFVSEVARGYLGTLWLARDPSDATERGTVLVRHIVPIATASAKAALLEAARWAHATGAPTLEILENRNGVDLVTAFSDAEPLRALLRTASLKHANVTPDVLLGIVKALVEQLDAVHDAASGQKSPHGYGGVHPDSILVGTDGHVELIDSGVGAAASAREPWRSDPQRVGYQAPEQADVKGVVDARTDIFSLGVILWEAFANKRLFPAVDAKSARDRLLKGAIARLDATRPTATAPAVPTDVANLVARALERDPAARFQSVEEMGKAIDALGPASAAQIGAFAASLGDVVIAKRRQMLERTSISPSVAPPPLSGRPSVAPSPRASVPPAAARPSVAPSSMASQAPPKPAGARASVPPAAPAATEAKPAAAPSTTKTAPTPTPAPTPAPTAPTAEPTAPTAATPAPTAEPTAPTAATAATPAPTAATPAPTAPTPARRLSTPPRPGATTTTATAEAPVATPAPTSVTPESSVPSTEPSARDAPAEPSPDYDDEPAAPAAAAQATADSSAAATASDDAPRSSDAAIVVPDTGRPEQGEMEVTDDELGAPPPPPSSQPPERSPSQRPMSLPPKLPPQSPHGDGPDASLLGAPTEALSGPIKPVSEFSALTSKPTPRKRRVALATIGAGVGGLLLGFAVLGRLSGKREKIVPVQAAAGAVVIVAQEPVPSAMPSGSAAASASAAPPAPAPTPESAAPSAETPPASEAKPADVPPSTASSPATAPAGSHHSTTPHGPVNSGYKPGGI